jgi:hypothetical protein
MTHWINILSITFIVVRINIPLVSTLITILKATIYFQNNYKIKLNFRHVRLCNTFKIFITDNIYHGSSIIGIVHMERGTFYVLFCSKITTNESSV